MDENASDLVVQLCARAGMIMEDHVDAALTLEALPRQDWLSAVRNLKEAASDIGALASAAETVLARY